MIKLNQNSTAGFYWLFDGVDIEEAKRAIEASDIRALYINFKEDIKLDNINFISEFPEIDYLAIESTIVIDISVIKQMSKLKHLALGANFFADFDVDLLVGLKDLTVDLQRVNFLPKKEMINVEKLGIWSYNGVDLNFLERFPFVKNFVLNGARKLISVAGIEACKNIEKLEISYCPNLSEIVLPKSLENLKYLEIDCLKKISSLDFVFNTQSIESIIIDKISSVESIEGIERLTNLKNFVLIDSDVKDGNLVPLLRLPGLKYCYISPNKKHYNPSASHIKKMIEKRG